MDAVLNGHTTKAMAMAKEVLASDVNLLDDPDTESSGDEQWRLDPRDDESDGHKYIHALKSNSGIHIIQPSRVRNAYAASKEFGLLSLFLSA